MHNIKDIRVLSDLPKKDLENKRVLLRADFNVPMGTDGIIDEKEDWRIKAVVPTIKYLVANKAKIILMSHLGRPNGKVVESMRLKPVKEKLSGILGIWVNYVPDCIGSDVQKTLEKMAAGDIILLENLRFYEGESENDGDFARKLASLGNIYVNDAFSDCHRLHASISAIAQFLPAYAGLLLEKEVKMMKKMQRPEHPAVAVIGGAKIETKLPAVMELSKNYDNVLVGGAIANEIINPPHCDAIKPNVILPFWEGHDSGKRFDIEINSIKIFAKFIKGARTIVWNGPMGKYEEPRYATGTKEMMELIKQAHKTGADVLIGGGETINAVQKFAPELMDKEIKGFNFSTGGGAMLDFLAGKELPGIEVLKK